ncbi:MAG: YCF48-related protein [Bacteroidetes bacterium]|nr:YCF48-related protein [Bacteroidota bacterium]
MKKFTLLFFLILLASVTRSQNWIPLNSGTTKNIRSVFFLNADTGYIVGDSILLKKTTDGGLTWTDLPGSGLDSMSYNSIFFTDAQHGYLAGRTGIILKTTDGGATWGTTILQAYVDCLYSMYFLSQDTGYLVGANTPTSSAIVRTYNGGYPWTYEETFTTKPLRSVYFTDNNTGFAAGDSGTIIHTLDAASTWDKQASGTTRDLHAVYFTDENTGIAAGDSGTILKTQDAGSNWLMIQCGTNDHFRSLHFPLPSIGYVCGTGGHIGYSDDGGIFWTKLYSGTSVDLNSIFFPTPEIGYAVGNNGTILKTTNGGGVGTGKSLPALTFRIHPNPAVDFIFLDLPELMPRAKISVMTISGQVLFEQEVTGIRTQIDMRSLNPSVYLIRYSDQQTSVVKKIVKE